MHPVELDPSKVTVPGTSAGYMCSPALALRGVVRGSHGLLPLLPLLPLAPLLRLSDLFDFVAPPPLGVASVVGAKMAAPPSRQSAIAVELRWVRRFIVDLAGWLRKDKTRE